MSSFVVYESQEQKVVIIQQRSPFVQVFKLLLLSVKQNLDLRLYGIIFTMLTCAEVDDWYPSRGLSQCTLLLCYNLDKNGTSMVHGKNIKDARGKCAKE